MVGATRGLGSAPSVAKGGAAAHTDAGVPLGHRDATDEVQRAEVPTGGEKRERECVCVRVRSRAWA